MTRYDPEIHHRRSIRLKGFDYSQAGAYFVTACVQNCACLFGHVESDEVVLNDAGRMILKWWQELRNKYPDIELDEYQVMPNHFHGIIFIPEPDSTEPTTVGAALCGRPLGAPSDDPSKTGRPHRAAPTFYDDSANTHESSRAAHTLHDDNSNTREAARAFPTVGDLMGWFKTMSTNEYIRGVKQCGWPPFDGRLWQRDFFDHIIRDEEELARIREYIALNPAKWVEDKYYSGHR